MLDETAAGVFTIAVTPFLPDGALDLNSIDTMVDAYVERGATGLESMTVVKRVVARTDLPIIVGVSSPGFAAMDALSKGSMDAGAAGVMVAPPGSLKTDAQIVNYYHNTAETLGDAPFVLQDFPLVTNVVISPSVILKIVEDLPTCVMLKHEDWPGLDKISTLRRASDEGARRISILCGNGGMFLLEEMLRGADGAMTGFGYPEMMAQVVAAYYAGDEPRARDIFDAYMPMVRYESQPGQGLAIRKHTLTKTGVIAHPTVRNPGGGLSAASIKEADTLADRQTVKLRELGL